MAKLILDASIVICWCEELEDPIVFDKLLDADFEPVIPERVAEEIESNNNVAEYIFQESNVRTCDESRHEYLSNRFFRLGSGEKAVLAIGQVYEKNGDDYYCVLDDGRARDVCEDLDLELIGTIGLFGKLVDQEVVKFEVATELQQEMKDNGTRLPEDHADMLDQIT